MRFAHLADCHIGSWRDPKLKDASTEAFVKAIDKCIKENVDFVLIAGDLFNSPFPRLDNLRKVVAKLKHLKDLDISVYIVPGSHDCSPSGKTMLDVLEEAGLFVNVFKGSVEDARLKLKFTVDKKTGTKITGMLGKKGALEKSYYEKLITENLESEKGYKIFLFHSGIDELKPKEMENVISQPISLLPKGFDYYAGGHVHIVEDKKIEGYGRIVYPGPLFPNSFSELEKLQTGGFFIVEDGGIRFEPIQIYNVLCINKNCTHKTPEQVKNEIDDEIKTKEFYNTIVLLRLHGVLERGKVGDIDFREIFSTLYGKSAYFVMKSTNLLASKEFEEIKADARTMEDVESFLIKEHIGQFSINGLDDEKREALVKNLLMSLSSEKMEGEREADFNARINEEVFGILEINL